MKQRLAPLAALLIASLASPACADAGINIGLNPSGDAEIKAVQYTCKNHDPVTVKYINAAPNYLAEMNFDGQELVFASSVVASGTKYVSGQYELFGKGSQITMQDVTEGLDAAPVLQCTADNLAP